MIAKIVLSDAGNYNDFREFLGIKVHETLHDIAAKQIDNKDVKLNTIKFSPAWNNWSVIKDENDEMEYFLIHDSLFKSIIYDNLIEEASTKYPDFFGINEPEKVLEALSNTVGIIHDSSKKEWYRQTSYVAVTNNQKEKVLYLGLFRETGNIKNKNEKEFKSGYLHCLKHFCGLNMQPITSNSESLTIPENFIEHIIRCLFEGIPEDITDEKNIPEDKYYVYKYIIDKKEYKFGYYYSHKFDIYFLSDARGN
jgi:hypothetical protein